MIYYIIILAILIVFVIEYYDVNVDLKKELRANTKLKNNYKGNGIVISTEDTEFKECVFTIMALRLITQTPIWIYHNGLSNQQIKYLRNLQVKVEKIDTTNREYLRAMSIINSPFQKVIYLDPKIIFLQDPSGLFNLDSSLFIRSRDFSINYPNKRFVNSLITYNIKNNPMVSGYKFSCQDPSFMYIVKDGYTMNKLLILAKNNPIQEIYWLAYELNKTQYDFNENIGVCSRENMYLDYNNNPFFIKVSDLHSIKNFKDYNNVSNGPLDYFQKTFSGEEINMMNQSFPENTMSLLNEYCKIWDTVR